MREEVRSSWHPRPIARDAGQGAQALRRTVSSVRRVAAGLGSASRRRLRRARRRRARGGRITDAICESRMRNLDWVTVGRGVCGSSVMCRGGTVRMIDDQLSKVPARRGFLPAALLLLLAGASACGGHADVTAVSEIGGDFISLRKALNASRSPVAGPRRRRHPRRASSRPTCSRASNRRWVRTSADGARRGRRGEGRAGRDHADDAVACERCSAIGPGHVGSCLGPAHCVRACQPLPQLLRGRAGKSSSAGNARAHDLRAQVAKRSELAPTRARARRRR